MRRIWVLVLIIVSACSTLAPTATRLPDGMLTITPPELTVPAGTIARFYIAPLPFDVPGREKLEWSVAGLPAGATGEFRLGWGDPADGPLLVRTDGSLAAGRHELTVRATTPQRQWVGQLALVVTACQEEVATGTFLRTVADHNLPQNSGGPSSTTNGIGSPLMLFCASATPRQLKITAQSATDETGQPHSVTGATFQLYRWLQYPADSGIMYINGGRDATAEEVARTDNGQLTWDVQPGFYQLHFDQYALTAATPMMGGLLPQVSIAYQVEWAMG